jgi:hypothetical protein
LPIPEIKRTPQGFSTGFEAAMFAVALLSFAGALVAMFLRGRAASAMTTAGAEA